MSDIHGDFETLDTALNFISKRDADVITIQGDLSGNVFSDEDERTAFMKAAGMLDNALPGLYRTSNGKINNIHGAAEMLVSNNVEAREKDPDKALKTQLYIEELKRGAQSYLDGEKKTKEKMGENYAKFGERFGQLESLAKRIVLVPGNWDGNFIDDYLAAYNLHLKHPEEIRGVKFAGYGGSRKHPIDLPFGITTSFSEDEAYNHLSQSEDAEVVLTHTVPRGFEFGTQFDGEYSLLAYMYRNAPSLLLTGDIHKPFISKEKKTGTVIANPGNLGRYKNRDFGTFLELEINDDHYVTPIAIYKVEGDLISAQRFAKE